MGSDVQEMLEAREKYVRPEHPQLRSLADRVGLLKSRCEAGLGKKIFLKAYSYVKRAAVAHDQDIRSTMEGKLSYPSPTFGLSSDGQMIL